jgi:hypothetical protein
VLVYVKVVLADYSGVAVAGTVISLLIEDGYLDPPHPATNDSGIARTVWTLKAEPGDYCISSHWMLDQCREIIRTMCVHIDIADSSHSE